MIIRIIKKLICPPATQDLELNTKNRDATIKKYNYGPLNVDEPGNYWEKIAEFWKTTEKGAKSSLCGNCVAFDISPRMKDCMPGDTFDDDGELGYCWMHHFKCHSARSCHTWAKGGPIKSDAESGEWQEKNKSKIEEAGKCQKGYKTHKTRKTKTMYGRTYRNCVKAEGKVQEVYSDKQRRFMCAMTEPDADRPKGLSRAEAEEMCKGPMKEADPKKGTGKKPKGSGRRLYTDEDPSDTVSVKFSTVQDVKDTFSKASFKAKSHKRQSQIINLVHQRARAAYKNAKDPKTKARLKKAYEYAKKRKEASKEKTKRMNKKK